MTNRLHLRQGRPIKQFTERLNAVIPPLNENQEKISTTNSEIFEKLDRFSLNEESRLRCETFFEQMMEASLTQPIELCFPDILIDLFSSNTAIVWSPNEDSTVFYSKVHKVEVKGQNTLLAAVCKSKTAMIVCSLEPTAPIPILQEEPKSPQLIFPLYLQDGSITCVVEIIRHISQPSFEDIDIKTANFLMEKFMVYGSTIIQAAKMIDFVYPFCTSSMTSIILPLYTSMLCDKMKAEICEFWLHRSDKSFKYQNQRFTLIEPHNVGSVTEAFRTGDPLLVKTARYHQCFCFNGDFTPDSSVICVPLKFQNNTTFAVVLRRQAIPFNEVDLFKLGVVAPFIIQSYMMSESLVTSRENPEDIPYRMKEMMRTAKLLFASKTIKETADSLAKKLCRAEENDTEIASPLFDIQNKKVSEIGVSKRQNGEKFNDDDKNILNAWSVFTSYRLRIQEILDVFPKFVGDLLKENPKDVIAYLEFFMKELGAKRTSIFVKSNFSADLIPALQLGKSNETISDENARKSIDTSDTVVTITRKSDRKNITAWNPDNDDINAEEATDDIIIDCLISVKGVFECELTLPSDNSYQKGIQFCCEYISYLLNKKCNDEIVMMGDEGYLISNYITAKESVDFAIPELLKIQGVFELDFSCENLDNIGLIKVCFFVFANFRLMHEMQINAGTLMKFFYRVSLRNSYAEDKDFKHTVKNLIFASKLIMESGVDLSRQQICCLLVAVLCRHIDSERVPDKYPNKCSISAGEFLSKLPVYESLSAETFISLSRGCSLFPENVRSVCEATVVKLIIDVAHQRHFTVLENIADTYDGILTLIMKASDYSICCAPYPEFEKEMYTFADMYYISGDISKIPKVSYTIFSKAREYIDKKATLPSFFMSVVVPLFDKLEKSLPKLQPYHSRVAQLGIKLQSQTPEEVDGKE
ncbi:hypothetical protein TVAG_411340 [Trichomonas vaginalis G3]|uniref:PDEase domain-containing protein n=1 Tax=Trichomonas vaginalis (strain ATCC PRA-98 / G3) TaxID=412133 RepID=A2DXN9_TRIV3|nr:HD-domain/PDEase-like family [Trichomonas vaginalis G3]EAY14868.1 hypothetical protein TVAG_411340 [Trichomonas vaginalis G3]KAI5541151.1 HD-domain/PDEase-like family [Trichomonas vaginalis G3]|eukprot:XP_001327091.1 hypothetical protein [Trichomonas vaginalis G3]